MTPMIDIVFQLLVFFIMTLNIVTPEGDFNVKMPLSASGTDQIDPVSPTVVLSLRADAGGTLAGMRLGQAEVRDFDELRGRVVGMVNAAGGPGQADLEVELACDERLHYDYVVKAMTAVSGRIEGGRTEQLVGKIKFSPPAKK